MVEMVRRAAAAQPGPHIPLPILMEWNSRVLRTSVSKVKSNLLFRRRQACDDIVGAAVSSKGYLDACSSGLPRFDEDEPVLM